ncbi:MAG: helix-turn-helix domain-containing protein [Deltaproteobacteria bacterium]|nr:helix-turn-helix domain-containing protein [Deltaproteobacteria bacterium]
MKANGTDPLAGLRESFEPWLRGLLREELAKQETLPKLLYSTKEAAQVLGVPETWLGAAARSGLVPCVHVGHYVRFAMRDLEAFIERSKGAVDNKE